MFFSPDGAALSLSGLVLPLLSLPFGSLEGQELLVHSSPLAQLPKRLLQDEDAIDTIRHTAADTAAAGQQ